MTTKVATILGTRPEIIRLSCLLRELESTFESYVINTNQNFESNLNDVFFNELRLSPPKYNLNNKPGPFYNSLSQIFKQVGDVLVDDRPDLVVVLGDTNSALSSLIAKRMGITVYHLEAGNRSFDENVPEEINRRVIDHLSDFNLCYTERSVSNLIAEGFEARRISVTGSPLLEVFNYYRQEIEQSKVLKNLKLSEGEYFLFTFHRQENVDNPRRLQKILASLQDVSSFFGLPVIVSTHPRTKTKLPSAEVDVNGGVVFLDAMGYFDFMHLQLNAKCVISDSGSISEEASLLNFKAVTLRDSMERPEALDVGSIVMSGLNPSDVIASISYNLSSDLVGLPRDYPEPRFSERVTKFILSTHHLNAKWHGLNSVT
jgi:UDP-N-acetylglucosamine 2-epimerase